MMDKLNQNYLLNRKEAAEFLGVKEMTLSVWKSTQRYNIPVIKVGRLVRYRLGDLLDFLERRTINKPAIEEEPLFKRQTKNVFLTISSKKYLK